MDYELNINEPDKSMAGVSAIYIVDARYVRCQPEGDSVNVSEASSTTWIKINATSPTFHSKYIEGNAYTNNVTMELYGTSNNYSAQFNKMVNARYVVKKIDNNGIAWIYGNSDEPLHFEWEDLDNGTPSDKTCYKLRFYGTTKYPPLKLM